MVEPEPIGCFGNLGEVGDVGAALPLRVGFGVQHHHGGDDSDVHPYGSVAGSVSIASFYPVEAVPAAAFPVTGSFSGLSPVGVRSDSGHVMMAMSDLGKHSAGNLSRPAGPTC
ncbi:hypothetical protein GCM10027068_09340 [Prescottella soli]